jgi:hypothetical protein
MGIVRLRRVSIHDLSLDQVSHSQPCEERARLLAHTKNTEHSRLLRLFLPRKLLEA